MYQEQLELDDAILAEAMSRAFKEMVGEQDCCFIAKGICHLCGTNERHLIPVVNFCPEFHVNHSLCREHLRSMHRVRMEDIFAGKNRPTVSKRSLKCSVCSRSCPCSTCQLEKQHEISKYKRWLAGEREYELDSEDRSMGSSGDQPRMRNPLPLSKKPRSSFGSNSSGGGREYLPNASQSIRELYGSQRLQPPVVDDGQAFQTSPHVDLTSPNDEHRLLPDLQAGAKPPSHVFRGAKRAAKDITTSHPPVSAGAAAAFGPHAMGQSPLNRVHSSKPIESPSAAHVLNCVESEKSLVHLLTTLNQEVASGIAEPKDSGSQPPANGLISAIPQGVRRQPSPLPDGHRPTSARSVDAHNGADAETSGPRSTAGTAGSSYTDAGDAGSLASTASSRNPKRKRDVNNSSAHADSETSSETSASNSRGGQQQDHAKTGSRASSADLGRKLPLSSTRGNAPQRESTPKPSPSAKLTTKPKQKDARQRSVPKASPTTSGRKRNGGEHTSNQPSAEKKNPHPRKPTPGSRGTTPRGPKVGGQSTNREKHAGTRKAVQANDDEGDEDSEIDTNLDYCEVCLAAGDLVCCDVCPRSFHLACLKMRESDLPEGDWQCAECRKPSFFVRYRATVHMKQSIYGKCVETIRCLKTHPYSKQFLSPVTNIEHYRSIVKQPMDLSTIEAKLKADKYTTGVQQQGEKQIDIESFANDVRLVWANCKLFNDDGSGITRAADELAAGFEDIYQDMQQYVKNITARSAARAGSKPSGPPQQAAKSTGGHPAASRASDGKKPVAGTENSGGNSGSADQAKASEGPASTSSTESETHGPSPSHAPPSSSHVVHSSGTSAQKPAEPKTKTLSSTTDSQFKAPASEAKSSDDRRVGEVSNP